MEGDSSAGGSVGDITFRITYDPNRTEGIDRPEAHSGDALLIAAGNRAIINLVTPSSGYDLNTYVTLHEIGHILGLHHPFEATYGWLETSYKQRAPDTIMAYNRDQRYLEDAPLFPLDVEALQFLYGAPGDDSGGVAIDLV